MKTVENAIFTILRFYDFTVFITKKRIVYFWMIVVAVGCSQYPVEVERALKLAGENRTELEKVLEHYKQHPEDSLKLKSAYFLIANMPYHYAIHDAYLESFKSYLKHSFTPMGSG